MLANGTVIGSDGERQATALRAVLAWLIQNHEDVMTRLLSEAATAPSWLAPDAREFAAFYERIARTSQAAIARAAGGTP